MECDNGDDPTIAFGSVQVAYPVARLVVKVVATDGFTLAYGNSEAIPPRYDLSLVADRLLTSTRNGAHLGADVQKTEDPGPQSGIRGGYAFWGNNDSEEVSRGDASGSVTSRSSGKR